MKPKFIFLFAIVVSFLPYQCSSEDAQFTEAGDANQTVLSSYAAKDLECGTTSTLAIPVGVKVRTKDLAACIANIASTPCSTWISDDPLPAACLAMQVDLD